MKGALILFVGYAMGALQFGAAPREAFWGVLWTGALWMVRYLAGMFIGGPAAREVWEEATTWPRRGPFAHYTLLHKGGRRSCRECLEVPIILSPENEPSD